MSTICHNCFTEREGGKVCPNCGYENNSASAKYPLALPEGAVLAGQYLIGRVLGQGGFGITYLALDQNSGDKVAIKEYFPETLSLRKDGVTTVSLLSDEKREDFAYGSEKFIEEARTLSTLSTVRGITQILGYFEENGTSYFAMEYIEGVSFKQYIANNGGKVTPDDAVAKLTPVMNALTAVHRLGLIHRDVTPDNIFITKDGDVKLLDFGSAQYSLGEKSQTLDAILKPGYAPKEQYMRRSRQGPFTDVYSLGACFYASITGVLPPESLERNENDEMLTLSEQGIAINPNVENAIMTALAVNAQDRFQTMEDFKAAVVGEVAVTAPVRTETQVSAPRYSARNSAAAAPQPAKKPGKALIAAIVGGVAVIAVVLILVITLPKGGTESQGGANASAAADEPNVEYQGETVTIAGNEVPVTSDGVGFDENTILTKEDFQNIGRLTEITQLHLFGKNVQNLTDFGFVEGLTKLRILNFYGSGNGTIPVTDITPLKNLTELTELRISSTDVTDISVLANMTKMESLELPYTISDLESLRGMTQLKSLKIYNQSGGNQTQRAIDLSPLANKTEMTLLEIYSFTIDDLTPLAGMTKLPSLQIFLGKTADISALAGMTELTSLSIYNTNGGNNNLSITDLSPLNNMTKLETLQIYIPVSVDDLEPLRGMTRLRTLYLRGNYNGSQMTKQVDISALSNLTEITKLWLEGMIIKELSPLAGLTKLPSLEVTVDNITDISALAGMTELTSLSIQSANNSNNAPRMTDLSPLKNLTKLEKLTLYTHVTGDLAPLAGLNNLLSLSIHIKSDETEQDISALTGMTNLTQLSILAYSNNGYCQIDLEPLHRLTALSQLEIYGVITNLEPLSNLTALESLKLRGWGNYNTPGLNLIPFPNLKNLTSLELESQKISDISSLSVLTSLVSIDLKRNDITDISALENLPNLQFVDLTDNPITDWSPVDHVADVDGRP